MYNAPLFLQSCHLNSLLSFYIIISIILLLHIKKKNDLSLIDKLSVFNKLLRSLLKTVSKFIKNDIRPFLSKRRNVAGIINDKMGQ